MSRLRWFPLHCCLPLLLAGCDAKVTVTHTPATTTVTIKEGPIAPSPGPPPVASIDLSHPSIALPAHLSMPVLGSDPTMLGQTIGETGGEVRLLIKGLKAADAGPSRFDVYLGLKQGQQPDPAHLAGRVEAGPALGQPVLVVTELVTRIAATQPTEMAVTFLAVDGGGPATITGVTLQIIR